MCPRYLTDIPSLHDPSSSDFHLSLMFSGNEQQFLPCLICPTSMEGFEPKACVTVRFLHKFLCVGLEPHPGVLSTAENSAIHNGNPTNKTRWKEDRLGDRPSHGDRFCQALQALSGAAKGWALRRPHASCNTPVLCNLRLSLCPSTGLRHT